jgi:hypothetical protein
MSLILEAIGVLAAGLVIAWLFATVLSPLQRSRFVGVGLAVTVLAGLLFVMHLFETGSGFSESTATAAKASLFEAEHGGDPNANNAFLSWARSRMIEQSGRGSTYYLEPASVLANPELGQWSTYVLLPERASAKLSEAEWVVFYEAPPSLVAQVSGGHGQVIQFSSGFAIARRSSSAG